MEYIVKKAPARPALKGRWEERAWQTANVLTLDHFLKSGSDHRPAVAVKLAYRNDGLYVFFRVADRYVRSTRTDYQASVCGDSCIEFFVQPRWNRGYFNFEINCGGTLLLYYIEDNAKVDGAFAKWTPVPRRLGRQVRIFHSLPAVVCPEIEKPIEWRVEYFVPLRLFEEFVGPLGRLTGQIWRANFYKCADNCSHPHWASWAPLFGRSSYHVPECFAPLRFV